MPTPLQRETKPDSPLRARTFGGAGSTIFGGILDDAQFDENSKTQGSKWYGEPGTIGEGQKMLSDPHVKRARDAVVDPVVGATWDFEVKDKNDLNLEIAEFCRFALFECFPWRSYLAGCMRSYMRDGFSLFEETEKVAKLPAGRFKRHPGAGMGVLLSGLHFRPAWTVWGWGQSRRDPTQLSYVQQYIPGSDSEDAEFPRINASRLLRFSWEQEGAHFEGSPIFRAAWGSWFLKRMLLKVEGMSHERNHLSQPVLIPPEGKDTSDVELTRLLRMFSNFRAHEKGAWILPGGYSLDFLSGQANTPIQSTIDRLNLDIALNVAAQFQLLGSKGTSGSYALAETQDGQFKITLDKHAHFICDVFNNGMDGWSPIERLVRLNYGPDVEVPKLVARNMPTVNWNEIIPKIVECKKSGLIKGDLVLDEFLRKVMMLPDIDEPTQETYAEVQPLPSSSSGGEEKGEQMEMFNKEGEAA